MTTTFKEQVAEDLAIIFNVEEFAEVATYKGTDIYVIEAEVAEHSTGSPGFDVPMFSLFLKAADVTRPKAGDTVVYSGVTCKVGPFPRSEGDIWQVSLYRDAVQV